MTALPPDPDQPDPEDETPLTEADVERFMAELGIGPEDGEEADAGSGAADADASARAGDDGADPGQAAGAAGQVSSRATSPAPSRATSPAPSPAPERVALVLTPVASAKALGSLCALAKLDALIVPSDSGAVAARHLSPPEPVTDWDIGELLGEVGTDPGAGSGATSAEGTGEGNTDESDGPTFDGALGGSVPPEAAAFAVEISELVRLPIVLVVAELAADVGLEEGLSGHVTARRYAEGKPAGDVPPGLLLAGADQVVEDLVLGRIRAADVPGALNSADITPGGALRFLGKLRRRPEK